MLKYELQSMEQQKRVRFSSTQALGEYRCLTTTDCSVTETVALQTGQHEVS